MDGECTRSRPVLDLLWPATIVRHCIRIRELRQLRLWLCSRRAWRYLCLSRARCPLPRLLDFVRTRTERTRSGQEPKCGPLALRAGTDQQDSGCITSAARSRTRRRKWPSHKGAHLLKGIYPVLALLPARLRGAAASVCPWSLACASRLPSLRMAAIASSCLSRGRVLPDSHL